jgi:hypothetical protein
VRTLEIDGVCQTNPIFPLLGKTAHDERFSDINSFVCSKNAAHDERPHTGMCARLAVVSTEREKAGLVAQQSGIVPPDPRIAPGTKRFAGSGERR